MKPPRAQCPVAGFTLLEVLAALGLCALLATAAAGAVAFSLRAERAAQRYGEATLLLPALYAAQQLHPDDVPPAPRGWRLQHTTDIIKIPDDLLQEWHRYTLQPDGREIPAITFFILDDNP
ncbi:MAG TPA: prepilin-type N-terminal cleavage/methylation domain-containing protein [Kiritimatiellia bacterium]|jgi:prepilin-type N-terminal cleavage/methylation domain-containing protein|nr:prepilin-type N-terminal cleavage/methylation domain-containing protein [Kiritimatiellia bacterium]MBP9571523.1 prepilin-type N-terminal cleavage/methylation domain-containing protein [Kiritimatiellia bacterium]HQF20290.1 prepilin-type N-terminal cleavage/methylation domain-containing protein [Kiritimatiellia bacterium]HQG75635.1 prepilin-type N-terminal cleavage/methylation domain-containing protein [Kiritimatiellia bacterium]HXK80398.1 prepilin-type N-terminal cleavage/methylation domain-c